MNAAPAEVLAGLADAAPDNTPEAAAETLPVATAEARAVAPLRVSGIEAVARSRLMTVPAEAALVEVAALLSGAQVTVVVVCDAVGAPLGIVTETMLVRRLGLGQADFFSTRAADLMSREFSSCSPDELLSDVLAKMHEHGLIHLLLIDSVNALLGVVNARDGLRALLAAGNHEEVLLRNYVMGIGYQ